MIDEFFQFVTRAVRVIDLITNIDMQAFQTHGGLQSFINRLDVSGYNFINRSCIQFYYFRLKSSSAKKNNFMKYLQRLVIRLF